MKTFDLNGSGLLEWHEARTTKPPPRSGTAREGPPRGRRRRQVVHFLRSLLPGIGLPELRFLMANAYLVDRDGKGAVSAADIAALAGLPKEVVAVVLKMVVLM